MKHLGNTDSLKNEKRLFRMPNALIIVGLVHQKYLPRASLDVIKIMSSLIKDINVLMLPALTFCSIVRTMWNWLSREIIITLSMVRLLKDKKKIDLILMHQTVTLVGCFLGKLIGAKVLVYVGGSIYETLYQKGLSKNTSALSILLWKIQLNLADKILLPTRQLVYISKLFNYKTKSVIVPTRFIKNTFLERTINCNKFYDRESIIGYIGRFEGEKGVEILPQVIYFTLKMAHTDNIKWVLVGDGSLRRTIESRVEELSLSNFVQFIGWTKNPEAYISRMKLLLLPSKSEGVPSVVLESMAFGTPVLATPVGGIPEIVKDNQTGFLLKSRDPRYIASRICELLRKPELLESVAKNSHEYVKQNFSYKKVSEAWKEIVKQLNIS